MHLTLHLTAKCNLSCKYCYAAPHEGGDMSIETAKAAIDLAVKDVNKNKYDSSLGIIFFGGEPLLKRDLIIEILDYCQRIEKETGQLFHFKITTNGILLDEDFIVNNKTAEVFVALSHDGLKASHDTNRVHPDGSGTFDELEDKITLLLKHKPYSPVMLVTTPKTVSYYADSVRYLYDKGFKYLICSLDYSADWNEADIRVLAKQYEILSKWYYDLTIKEAKFYFSPFEVKIESHIYPGSCKAGKCQLGQTQISVAPNGNLFPCVQFVGDGSLNEYCIGNVQSGIDETSRSNLFLQNSNEKSTCIDCAIKNRCNHYCGCLNKQATGSIDVVSSVLCAHERTVLPIADKLAKKLYKKRNGMFIQKHYNELYPIISLVEEQKT